MLLRDVATVVILMITGWSLWERRISLRSLPADRVMTLGCLLCGAGLLLFQARWMGAVFREVAGTAYLHCYISHLLLMSAAGCQIFAAGCRLVPDSVLGPLMRRMDVPAAAAASIMLICIFSSDSARKYFGRDFCDFTAVPPDFWLRAYWFTFAASGCYLLGFLVWLMLPMRQDPRSTMTADLFIVASVFGITSMLDRIAMLTPAHLDPHGHIARYGLYLCVTVATVACAQSWRTRMHEFRKPQCDPDVGELQNNIGV